TPAVNAVAYGQGAARVQWVRHPSEQADVLRQHLFVLVLVLDVQQLRPELTLYALVLDDEDLAGLESRIGDLPDWQLSHFGQPPGYLVPDNAADEDEVPSQFIGLYVGRSPEVHGHRRVFCPYMPMQF